MTHDVFTQKKRSEVMARIRGRGNRSTEMAMVSLLRRNHITGWRRHLPLRVWTKHCAGGQADKHALVVRPDFVFQDLHLALFVDGCFWHLCPLHTQMPTGNADFWQEKLERNATRDRTVDRTLRWAGWSVLRIWEHELSDESKVVSRLRRRFRRLHLTKNVSV